MRGNATGQRADRAASLTGRMLGALAITVIATSSSAVTISYTDLYTVQTPPGFSFAQPQIGRHLAAGGQLAGYGRYGPLTGNTDHALLWTPSAANPIDLHPAAFTASTAYGTNGTQQVGDGFGPTTGGDFIYHALLWNGSAESAVDLNPAGFRDSHAWGTTGTQQVGYGSGAASGWRFHALLWGGSADSAVDLNPVGLDDSYAVASDGTRQVGYGSVASAGTDFHALLWSGSAASVVDLSPAGFTSSSASGIGGLQQVGTGYGPATGGDYVNHALLWTGSAESAVDLNPAGFTFSVANDTNGTQQVGYGYGPVTRNVKHALLWNGSANTFVDLNSVLPASYTEARAFAIEGNKVYGWAINGSAYHAITWTVPEPAGLWSVSWVGAGAAALHRRRRPA